MSRIFKTLALCLLLLSLSSSSVSKRVIVIDAGHGGKDSGAKTSFVHEKDFTLAIAKKIKTLAKDTDVKIVLTREEDSFVSLDERVNMINTIKPDRLISLHINKSDEDTENGYEFYVSDKNKAFAESLALASKILPDLPSELRFNKIASANFYLLRSVDIPATILQLGYLSNEKDYGFINSEKGQDQIAQSILKSLTK